MSKRMVICSLCNTQMNHHADKISWPDSEPDIHNAAYDELLQEYYACPNCGNSLNVIVSEEEL